MIRRLLAWLRSLGSRGAYQVYGGPRDGEWTDEERIPGYYLGEDLCSERLYHVWLPAPVAYEAIAEALDNSRESSDEAQAEFRQVLGEPWFASLTDEELRDDLMDKCSDAEGADPARVLEHVVRYRGERGL